MDLNAKDAGRTERGNCLIIDILNQGGKCLLYYKLKGWTCI